MRDQEQSLCAGAEITANVEGLLKSSKQLEKEKKKQEKIKKLMAKNQKMQTIMPIEKNKKSKSHAIIEYTVNTPLGEKKDVTDFPQSYSPRYVESHWYAWWKKQGYFKPTVRHGNQNKPFVMVLPPPNVTGTLHLGHALTCSIEDCLARYYRMCGREVLWVPGSDHAGIATQVVVEKRLWTSEGKTRFDLGRNEFVNRIWKWKLEKGNTIHDQMELMGTSCDWDRAVFTMDKIHSDAVEEAFIRLHDSGQIYRDSRIVNWSVALKSVISDIEVNKIPLSGKTYINVPGYDKRVIFGILTCFTYKIIGGGEIEVATTRIETMLADVAISVHPDDDRYRRFHGKYAEHPFFPDRKLPVVLDEQVDMDYGTGAVKISPAHDVHDFEIAKRYNLPIICCLSDDGKISQGFGEAEGMKRFDARLFVTKKLDNLGLLGDTSPINMVLPVCSRSGDIIEPMVKPQWFVRMKNDSLRALELIKNRSIEIIPSRYESDCDRWLSVSRDWCISRQLWWGHQVPAYRFTSSTTADELWLAAKSETDAGEKFRKQYPMHDFTSFIMVKDEDVLDTWFSSSLFPFSVFGWPAETDDLRKYYPGSLLETGHDILFFWVLRMIIMSLKLNNQVPFKQVYLHGLVRDSHGRKMSKSLGNVIDPLNVIRGISLEGLNQSLKTYNLDPKELQTAKKSQKTDFPNGVPECGTDALRFAFAAYCSQSTDINLDVLRLQGYRHFCNKIWNACRFASSYAFKVDEKIIPVHKVDLELNVAIAWILSRLYHAVSEANAGLLAFDFARSSTAVYNFWLYELCDVYIEMVKPCFGLDPADNERISMISTLRFCLDIALRLIHPFMPFISEELYHRLPPSDDTAESICIAQYPQAEMTDGYQNRDIEDRMTFAQRCVTKIRRVKNEHGLETNNDIKVCFPTKDNCFANTHLVTSMEPVIRVLAGCQIVNQIKGNCVEEQVDACELQVQVPEYSTENDIVNNRLRRLNLQ